MQLTIRVPDEYGEKLSDLSGRLGLKRSDIVRLALKQFLESEGDKLKDRPFDRVRNLLGTAESGIRDLGQSHREHLVNRIRRESRCGRS